MPTVQELGQRVKAKYPGAYDDIDDIELGNRIKTKYPGAYDDYTEAKGKKKIPSKGAGAKALEVGMRTLGFQADVTARQGLSRLLSNLPEVNIPGILETGKKAKEGIKKAKGREGQMFASDIYENILPFLKSQPRKVPSSKAEREEIRKALEAGVSPSKLGIEGVGAALPRMGRILARLGIDITHDPLTYEGGPGITQLGKARRSLQEYRATNILTGKPLPLDSKLAKIIAKEEGFTRPTAGAIAKFSRTKPSKTISGRIAAGEQSLVSFGPFKAKGKLASKVVKPFEILGKTKVIAKINQITRDAFKVSTGHHDYDVLYFKHRNLALHKAGIVIQDAKVVNDDIRALAKARSVPTEVIHKEINQLVEQVIPRSKAYSKQAYGAAAHEAMVIYYSDVLTDAKMSFIQAQKIGDVKAMDLAKADMGTYQGAINEITGKYTPVRGIDPRAEKIARDIKNTQENQRLAELASPLGKSPELLADIAYLTHATLPGTQASLRSKWIAEGKLPPKASSKEFNTMVQNHLTRQISEIKPHVIDAWQSVGLISKRKAKSLKGKDGVSKLYKMLQDEKITTGQFTNAVHTLSLEDIRALPRDVKERIFGAGVPDEVFHTDPVYYTTIRNIRGQRAITSAEFFQELKVRGIAAPENQAMKDRLVKQGLINPKTPIALANWSNVRQSELNGFKVPPEVARGLNKWREFQLNPKDVSQALATYDKFHTLTKAWALAIFPAYHSKNMVGNFWNNWLAGVNNPLVYTQADKVLRDKKLEITDIFGKKWTSSELKTEMSKLGIIGRGQFNQELTRTIAQHLDSGKFFTMSSRSRLLRAGRQVGQFLEDNARAAHFIDRLKKGDTAEQAALSVKKYLFDYGELTDLERQVLNRVFFFYKWTKENLPLQLHSMVTTPWKFGVPFKAKAEIEKEVPQPDERYLYDYFKDNFPVRVRYNDKIGKYEYFMLNSWLPAADLLKLNQLHDIGLQMLAPLPKGIIEWLWNYSLYFKKKIERTKGQKDKFLGIDLPAKVTNAAKIIRFLNEIDKMSNKDRDLMSKLTDFMGGKTYSFDPQEGKVSNYYKVKDEVEQLMSELYKIERKKPVNEAEKQRIIQLIQDKNKEY